MIRLNLVDPRPNFLHSRLICGLIVALSTLPPLAQSALGEPVVGLGLIADIPLCEAARNQLGPDMVSDGARGAFIVWQDNRDSVSVDNQADIYAAHLTKDAQQPWGTNGTPVCVLGANQVSPRVSLDGLGGIVAVWADGRNAGTSSTDIFAQRLRANGLPAWTSNGVAICTAAEVQIDPQIVPDGSGGAVIVWQDRRLEGQGGFSDRWSLFAQRVDSLGTTLWTSNGVAIQDTGRSEMPVAVSDGAGGAFVAWQLNVDPTGPGATTRTYVARISGDGTVAWKVIATTTSLQTAQAPSITIDDSNGVIVVWTAGAPRQVYAMRFDPDDGTRDPLWAPLVEATPGTIPFQGNQDLAVVTGVRSGGVVAAWIDSRQSRTQAYGQRISLNGSIAWPDTGLKLGGQLGGSYLAITRMMASPHPPVSDGGAIVVWDEDTGILGSAIDVRAQSVDGSGALMAGWGGEAGRLVPDTQLRTQTAPVITTDMFDGAFVSWHDDRNFIGATNFDIYVTRIRWDGAQTLDVSPDNSGRDLVRVFPNPVLGSVTFNISPRTSALCTIRVLDIQGRMLAEVLQPTVLHATNRIIVWNGLRTDGKRAEPGVYFANVQIGERAITRRFVVIR